MKYRQYKFKFYLNASHAIYINGKQGDRHPHTWEIAINTLKQDYAFVEFHKIEAACEEFLSTYQDQFLNECDPFKELNPTLENCCEYFKTKLSEILNEHGWILLLIEMSETPSRSFVINLLDEENTAVSQMNHVLVDTLLEEIINEEI